MFFHISHVTMYIFEQRHVYMQLQPFFTCMKDEWKARWQVCSFFGDLMMSAWGPKMSTHWANTGWRPLGNLFLDVYLCSFIKMKQDETSIWPYWMNEQLFWIIVSGWIKMKHQYGRIFQTTLPRLWLERCLSAILVACRPTVKGVPWLVIYLGSLLSHFEQGKAWFGWHVARWFRIWLGTPQVIIHVTRKSYPFQSSKLTPKKSFKL